jgi:hypothetical protein
MNAKLLPALARTIEFLREASRAPSTDWPSCALALPSIPRVGVEAGEVAMALAASARSIVRQLPRIPLEADAEMRATLKGLADVLQHEFNRRYEPPYYADRD